MTNEHGLTHRIAAFLLDHTRALLVGLGVALVVAVLALTRFKFTDGIEVYYDRSVPEQKQLEEVVARFVGEDVLVVAYSADDVFSKSALETLRKLGEGVKKLEVQGPDGSRVRAIQKVDSLATVKDLYGGDMSFRAAPLVPDPVPAEPAALDAIRKRAFANPIIQEGLLAKDSTAALLVARLTPGLTEVQSSEAVEATRKVMAEAATWGGIRDLYLAGLPVISADTAAYQRADIVFTLPPVDLLILVLLFVFLRRARGVMLVYFTVFLARVVGLASLPALGTPMSNTSVMLIPVVTVTAATTMIHLLSELAQNARLHGPARAAQVTLAELFAPSFMCTFTTAVGFAAISTSHIPVLRQFGISAAVAVTVTFVVTMMVAAVAMKLRPPDHWLSERSLSVTPAYDALVDRYFGALQKRPVPFFLAGMALFVALTAGVPKLVVDNNFVENFKPSAPVRKAATFIRERLGGAGVLAVSIQATGEQRFYEPSELKKLEALEAFLRSQASVERVIGFASHVKLMHRGFFEENASEYRIPDTREQVAQLILLNSDESLTEYIDEGRSWTRLFVRFTEESTDRQMLLFNAVDAYLAQNFPASAGYKTAAVSEDRILTLSTTGLVASQTSSLGLAFLTIFLPIFLLLRSFRAGLYSIPSNLLPVGALLGLMGWFGIRLDVSTVMIAPVTLGIVVDDTIHLLENLRSGLARNQALADTLRETIRSKLAGVMMTTAAFGGGFSTLVVSNFPPVTMFGIFAALSLILGLVAELVVLPPLFLLTRTRLGVPPPAPGIALSPVPPLGAESQSRLDAPTPEPMHVTAPPVDRRPRSER